MSSSYDYSARQGILPISWEGFHGLCKGLARAAAAFGPEIILAAGRGGFYPGALIAQMLRVEIYPIRLSRRVEDEVRFEHPRWLLEPPALAAGKRVLIVDEIASTGETLRLAAERARQLGAADVRTAVLCAHTWGADAADYIGLISDALLLNPWDREIFAEDEFRFHPEYAAALAEQGIAASPALLIPAPEVVPDKGKTINSQQSTVNNQQSTANPNAQTASSSSNGGTGGCE